MAPLLKNISLAFISFFIAALLCQYRGDDWEEKLRQTLYKLTNDSIPNYAKTLTDKDGIPYVLYSSPKEKDTSKQYNPTIVANYAIDYYSQHGTSKNDLSEKKFRSCIEWLMKNISSQNNYALYEFHWKQPFYDSVGVPWTSGMSSGRAMEAFTLAYKRYQKQEYLEAATKLMRGFYQPIEAGGFTYKEPSGWWYEEFADSNLHTPRILDGHIYAITGVHRFRELTKNDSASFIFQQGIRLLKDHLSAYDVGNGWSYYDIYQSASDKKYHILLTAQMKELWEITGDSVFLRYYRSWEKPLNRPYVYRIIKEKNRSGLILYFLLSSLFFLVIYLGLRRLSA